MRISLKNTLNETIPYNIHLEIAGLTSDRDKQFDIPIYVENINKNTVYDTEVCGFRLEADSPEEVVFLAEKLLPGLVVAGRFPTYIFITRRSRRMYPVYTIQDEVYATTPGGPVFRHIELAKVREYLTSYLRKLGKLGEKGKSEKLHVRGIRKSDLSLTRPLFYLKKRADSPEKNEFWAPVFQSSNGNSIYTYAASARREVDVDGGHEILRLRSQVAQALIADNRLVEDLDLRADRLLPDYWKNVEPTLEAQAMKLSYNGTTCNVYRDGNYKVAVEYRPDEDRYSFYIGHDMDQLCERAAKDLMRRGIIKDSKELQLQN
jgi:hypothetical protein